MFMIYATIQLGKMDHVILIYPLVRTLKATLSLMTVCFIKNIRVVLHFMKCKTTSRPCITAVYILSITELYAYTPFHSSTFVLHFFLELLISITPERIKGYSYNTRVLLYSLALSQCIDSMQC